MDECLKVEEIFDPDKKFSGIGREKILDRITDIAQDAFGTDRSREDHENHSLRTDLCYFVKDEGGRIVGYASYNFLNIRDKKVCYLQGIAVEKESQKKGIFYEVNRRSLSKDNFDFLMLDTQSPIVYAATKKIVDELYPTEGQTTPSGIKELAKAVANDFLKLESFNEDTFVLKGIYGTCLYDIVPGKGHIRDFFDSRLDYSSGDAMMLVGRLSK